MKENKSIGKERPALAKNALPPAESKVMTRNGAPLLKVQKGARRVTSELVRQLREELT